MADLSIFCTCTNLDCSIHPTKHDRGCAPCIAKNLRVSEIPACFFNKIKGSEDRKSDSFEVFADLVSCKEG